MRKGKRRTPYTSTLDQNLFERLTPEARKEFDSGDGDELNDTGGLAKMQAIHSSSAICVNVFHYWKRIGTLTPVLGALGLPQEGGASIRFEQRLPIQPGFRRAPNIDVSVQYSPGNPISIGGIESKFTEPFRGKSVDGLKPKYLDLEDHWIDLPSCRNFAELISPHDTSRKHLHAAQLIKHTLGLIQFSGSKDRLRLVYLWFDPGGEDGRCHLREVEEFSKILQADGISFTHITYQKLVRTLQDTLPPRHDRYLAYLQERYI